MALFLVAQSAAVHARGLFANASGSFAEKCERANPLQAGGETRAPAAGAEHDCDACLACVYASLIDARRPVPPGPYPASRMAVRVPETAAAPLARWRAAYPARAPPLFS